MHVVGAELTSNWLGTIITIQGARAINSADLETYIVITNTYADHQTCWSCRTWYWPVQTLTVTECFAAWMQHATK